MNNCAQNRHHNRGNIWIILDSMLANKTNTRVSTQERVEIQEGLPSGNLDIIIEYLPDVSEAITTLYHGYKNHVK